MKPIAQETLRFIDRWYWVLLVLAAPLLLFPSPQRSWAMFVVPAGWLVAWLAVGRPLPSTPLNLSLLLGYVMVLVSLHSTYDVAVSLPKISGMVLGIGVFFIVARTGQPLPLFSEEARETFSPSTWGAGETIPPSTGGLRGATGWWICLVVFLGLGVGTGALAVLGTSWGAKIEALRPILAELQPRIKGLPGAKSGLNANEVAGGLVWVIPLALTLSALLIVRVRNCWRALRGWLVPLAILILTATVFLSGVLVLTQSRGAYIGLVSAVLLLVAIVLPRIGRLSYLILLALALVVLIGSIQQVGLGAAWDRLAGDEVGTMDVVAKLETRQTIWAAAMQGIQDFKFTGMGMNTFRGVVRVLYPLPFDYRGDIAHAHNEFLQAGLDLGVPGLIAFIALYIGAFMMLWEVWRRASLLEVRVRPEHLGGSPLAFRSLARALVLGLGGGLLAHAIYGLTDAVALGAKPGVLFWMLLGLICGLHAQTRSDPDDAASPN